MSIRIINGKVYKNGTFSEEDLVLKEGKISSAEDENADEVYDAKGKYVVPGFIDVHTHGGAGVDVMRLISRDLKKSDIFLQLRELRHGFHPY